jgi:hypothetical protein
MGVDETGLFGKAIQNPAASGTSGAGISVDIMSRSYRTSGLLSHPVGTTFLLFKAFRE